MYTGHDYQEIGIFIFNYYFYTSKWFGYLQYKCRGKRKSSEKTAILYCSAPYCSIRIVKNTPSIPGYDLKLATHTGSVHSAATSCKVKLNKFSQPVQLVIFRNGFTSYEGFKLQIRCIQPISVDESFKLGSRCGCWIEGTHRWPRQGKETRGVHEGHPRRPQVWFQQRHCSDPSNTRSGQIWRTQRSRRRKY